MSNKPDRITFQTRFEEMVGTLRKEILSSIRPAGDYLPSELALADQYLLSKKSVRKALDILVSEGLIEKVPRVGNRIIKPDAEHAVTVRIGCYPSLDSETGLQELLRQFQLQHPHIQVETAALPYTNYPDSVRGYLSSGWLDVMSLNNWNFLEMADRDALDLFEPRPPNPAHYSFLPDVFARSGNQAAQPLLFSPVILCYNKTLFRQLRLPEPDSSWSWDRLSEVSLRIKEERGISGFYAHIASTNRFPVFLLQNGFKFRRTENGCRFDDPLLWESLKTFRDLIHTQGPVPSFLSEGDADAEKLFAQQKTAMIMTTYYGLKYLNDLPFEYDLAPLPYTGRAKTLLLVTGLAVNRASRQKEAAGMLVDFLCSEAAQLSVRRNTLSIPASKSAAEWEGAETLYRPSRYHMYREIVPTFGGYEELNITIEELDRLRSELKLFWSNLEQPESVIQRLGK
ncbi:extracellular solute-binding protein [Paenibacillus sp. RC84]|uniref:extracellular solute-binding protein n=1 Tax=Paenibacillus sp. RC84 TaxID=3156252 RepID=UPI0035128A46